MGRLPQPRPVMTDPSRIPRCPTGRHRGQFWRLWRGNRRLFASRYIRGSRKKRRTVATLFCPWVLQHRREGGYRSLVARKLRPLTGVCRTVADRLTPGLRRSAGGRLTVSQGKSVRPWENGRKKTLFWSTLAHNVLREATRGCFGRRAPLEQVLLSVGVLPKGQRTPRPAETTLLLPTATTGWRIAAGFRMYPPPPPPAPPPPQTLSCWHVSSILRPNLGGVCHTSGERVAPDGTRVSHPPRREQGSETVRGRGGRGGWAIRRAGGCVFCSFV